MIRALGLPHFGQTSRWGAGTLGVLRFWRRSVWMESGCIDVPPIISNQGATCGSFCGLSSLFAASPTVAAWCIFDQQAGTIKTLMAVGRIRPRVCALQKAALGGHHGDSRRTTHDLVNCRAAGDCGDRAAARKSLTMKTLLISSGSRWTVQRARCRGASDYGVESAGALTTNASMKNSIIRS